MSAGAAAPAAVLRDAGPQPGEEADVVVDLALGGALAGGAHDEAALRRDARPRRWRAGGRARSGPRCGARCRCAACRHEHEVAAGQRDVRRHARALGADRLLRDLHEQLLALRQPLLDRRERRAAPRRPRVPSASLAPARPPTARRRPVRSARRHRGQPPGLVVVGWAGSAPAGGRGRRRAGTPPSRGRCRRTPPACPAARAPPCPCRCCRRCRARARARRRARPARCHRERDPGLPGGRIDEDLLGHGATGPPPAPPAREPRRGSAWRACGSAGAGSVVLAGGRGGRRRRRSAAAFPPRPTVISSVSRAGPVAEQADERRPRVDDALAALSCACGRGAARRCRKRATASRGRRQADGRPDRRRSTSQRKPAIGLLDAGRRARNLDGAEEARARRAARRPRRRAHLGGGQRRGQLDVEAARPRSTRPPAGPGRTTAWASDDGRARTRSAGGRGGRRARTRCRARACR